MTDGAEPRAALAVFESALELAVLLPDPHHRKVDDTIPIDL
jgi:hypothetical protein